MRLPTYIRKVLFQIVWIFVAIIVAGCSSHSIPGWNSLSIAVERKERFLILRSPQFAFTLDTANGLHAIDWSNRLSGQTLDLGGGLEFETDLDAAERRSGITGWKFAASQETDGSPDEENGFRSGFAKPDFNDAGWMPVMTPNGDFAPQTGYAWVRRDLSFAASDRGKPVFLTVGGFGLFDFRYMRVFLNGEPVGIRDESRRRTGPLTIALPGHLLHFGGKNVLAIQLGRYDGRLQRLDALDPERRWNLSRFYWPPSFEQVIAIGGNRLTPAWRVTRVNDQSRGNVGEVVITLASDQTPLEATVTYRWSADDPVLRKAVQLCNTGKDAVRVLDVRLGSYQTKARTTEGEQGHPVYADGEFFLGVAHPAGWATGEKFPDDSRSEILLHHHPGKMLAPGERFDCFEAVYGVSRNKEIAETFKAHIRSRMRRTIRGHDRPYAFFEPFGSDREKDKYDAREDRLLPNLTALEEFTKETGCRFDDYSIEFWEDLHGDRSSPDPTRFPHGFRPLQESLGRMNTALGLWTDITGPDQSIGNNPAIAPTLNYDPAFGTERKTMCLATDPMPSLHRNAFLHHLRENGVRVLKFDGYWAACRNNSHAHLPGIYATEAIHSAFISSLHEMDTACPGVFFELYGGYHSPWWLLHADTIYESGLQMEAATPGPWPTLYARDGVTRVLDQSLAFAAEDTPALGKDSLGVWLSDWKWNSHIGAERWEEGFVMDMARGNLLAQPWCDVAKLSPAERQRMADFIALLRAQPRCFAHTQLVLGSPWKEEPYGYCGTDGHRAMIALNNSTWESRIVTLQLNSAWRLPAGKRWDIYRWHPSPSLLRGSKGSVGETVNIALRPFEIVLLEVVPAGESPTLHRRFDVQPLPMDFAEAARALEVTVGAPDGEGFRKMTFTVPPTGTGGSIAFTADVRLRGLPLMRTDAGSHYEIKPEPTALNSGAEEKAAEWMPVLAKELYYKTSWQAWRARIGPADHSRTFVLRVKGDAPQAVTMLYQAHFIPH